MERKSHSFKYDQSVKEKVEQPKDGVLPPSLPIPLPQPFCIKICFPRKDVTKVKEKYKVMDTQRDPFKDYYRNLGFVDGVDTLMFVRNKKIKYPVPGKSARALARSWFKEVVTKKDQCHKNVDDEAEVCLRELHEQVRAAKTLVRMGRKEKGMLSLYDIVRAIEQESGH